MCQAQHISQHRHLTLPIATAIAHVMSVIELCAATRSLITHRGSLYVVTTSKPPTSVSNLTASATPLLQTLPAAPVWFRCPAVPSSLLLLLSAAAGCWSAVAPGAFEMGASGWLPEAPCASSCSDPAGAVGAPLASEEQAGSGMSWTCMDTCTYMCTHMKRTCESLDGTLRHERARVQLYMECTCCAAVSADFPSCAHQRATADCRCADLPTCRHASRPSPHLVHGYRSTNLAR